MSDWLRNAQVGDQIVRLTTDERNRVVAGQVCTITSFHANRGMKSDFGTYDVGFRIDGNRTTVFDPRGFRPAEGGKPSIAWAHDILRKASRPIRESV